MIKRKTNFLIISALAVLIVSAVPSMVSAMGNGRGAGNGTGQQLRDGSGTGVNARQNAVDSDNDGTPDGLEDDDGDGILNKDDSDYEKQYVNMKDDDGDGIPNKDDEDYTRPLDGSGRPETAGQGSGQGNRPDNVTPGQGQGNKPADAGTGRGLQNTTPGTAQAQRGNRVRTNNPAIGQQIRTMLQQEDQTQEELIQEVEQIRQTSGLKKFFFGADRDTVQKAESKLAQREQRLEELKNMLNEVDDPALQEALEQQIAQMEEVTANLETEVKKGQGGIFSWFTNLFN